MRPVISFEQYFESVWLKIPELWREADRDNGSPLQIITLTMCQQMYYSFYLKIAAMDELFDPDLCPEKYLPFLASTVNWKLLGKDVKSWRNQIKHAPLLYKIKGTSKSITIAEKLIGYSVFMTELYRDYNGLIVTKDKLFNNIPLSVKIKPWFRKTSTDLQDVILNESLSDQLPSFNKSYGDLGTDGQLSIPRKLRISGIRSVDVASLKNYDYLTGENSLTRLCKLPRINTILRCENDLDSAKANLAEALDLFMQFKPFHIYVNSLLVMYNLSDYILGSKNSYDSGTGELSGDTILSREDASIHVSVLNQDVSIDKISYFDLESTRLCDNESLTTVENSRFKGLLDTVYNKIPLEFSLEKDCNYLTSLGFSLSGYARNIQTDRKGLSLWHVSDFSNTFYGSSVQSIFTVKAATTVNISSFTAAPNIIDGVTLEYNSLVLVKDQDDPKENGLYYVGVLGTGSNGTWLRYGSFKPYSNMFVNVSEGTQAVQYILVSREPLELGVNALIFNRVDYDGDGFALMDTATSSVLYSTLIPEPIFGFAKIDLKLPYAASFSELFSFTGGTISQDTKAWYSDITSVTVDLAASYKDTLVADSVTYNYESVPAVPVSFRGASKFLSSITDPITYSLYDTDPSVKLKVSQPISTELEVVQLMFKHQLVILLKLDFGAELLLLPKKHFIYDHRTESLILNQKVIYDAVKDNPLFTTASTFFVGTLHILYTALVPTALDLCLSSSVRSMQLSNNREQKQFNRITYLDNSAIQAEIDTAHQITVMDYSDDSGTLVENFNETKLFREQLPRVFYRDGLHFEDTGTPYLPVTYDTYSPLDESKWLVYVDPSADSYLGSEKISKSIWANYFNVPFATAAQVSYTSLDISGDAQIINRDSARWLAVQENISITHPEYFLSSRADVSTRTSLWNRGSARKMPIPYIGASRARQQGFRTSALFNRTENLPDYVISASANYGTDTYKYSKNGLDHTLSYRNPVFPVTETHIPQTEVRGTGRALVSSYGISYPENTAGYETQYEAPFDFVHRAAYYNDLGTQLRPSLYACNIRTDVCPYSGDIMNDSADHLDFSIDGSEQVEELFNVTSENDTEFALTRTDIFVAWREVNTGHSLGIGLFPPVNLNLVRPNARVFKNGIEIPYGQKWVFAANPNRVVLTSNCLVSIGDTIQIIYYASTESVYFSLYPTYTYLSGITLVTVPASLDNTESYIEDTNIVSVVDKQHLYRLPFINKPIIAWYRYDNGDYISTSIDTGVLNVPPTTPVPTHYKELALPNIAVRRNGVLLPYFMTWNFIAIPGTVSYKIELNQSITQSLQIGDVLTVSYSSALL